MKKLIVFSLILLLSACGKDGNKLSGKITNAAGKTLYLERFEKNIPVVVDSVAIDESGEFSLTFPNKIDFYRLRLDPQNFCVLILDSTSKEVILNADGGNLQNSYTVEGSKNSLLTKEFFDKTNAYFKKREELRIQLEGLALEDSLKRAEILDQVNQEIGRYKEYRNSFVDQNRNSPAIMSAMGQFDPLLEFDYLKKIEAAMATSMPNSEYHLSIKSQVAQVEMQKQLLQAQQAQQDRMNNLLKPGTEAPEIELPDPSGKIIKLSSLRGKVVLIDFWASWCGPCRRENPNVVRMYSTYSKKGFEIYSVSLDKDKQKWVQAIEQDGLSWKSHVSDLQFWSSPVVNLYGFDAIPFTVLIDKDGKVIGTNLRGPELENKLGEIIGA